MPILCSVPKFLAATALPSGFPDGSISVSARKVINGNRCKRNFCDTRYKHPFPGHRTLTDFIDELEENKFMADMEESVSAARVGSIPEGSRNSTISHAAGKILKRWGDTPEAYEHFMEIVAKCVPPLPESEVNSTWRSAVRFFHEKVERQHRILSCNWELSRKGVFA